MLYVVTGANRGIGLELVRQIIDRGDQALGTARDLARADELKSSGARVLELDVGDAGSVASFAEKLRGTPVDVLINNSGIRNERDELDELDFEGIIRTFNVNALGALRVTHALLPEIRRSSVKKIVMISSKMGSVADNGSGGSYGYRMSKAAMNMAARSLARDLAGEGIIAVAMNPGWVRTDMGGGGAPASVEDSARGILRQIDRLALGDSGEFVDYLGRGRVPW
ncbi:MAG: SDR family oxidoreductase [Deltaproteobacteria bacterium]|nr:SDR family oxidoreductase [Deltaproteobacteria bacterium]